MKAFHSFCETEKSWLADYTLFRVLMENNGDRETWDEWRPEHSDIDAAHRWLDSLGEAERAPFEERRDFHNYVQWIAHRQWREVKAYAEAQGVALMGDIPFWHQLLQRRRFRASRSVRARLVGRRATRALFQGRCLYPKMGPELGHPALSLGRDAQPQFRLVAAAGPRSAGNFSPLPHRSRARVLPHLRFPLAAGAESRISPARLGGNARLTGGREPHFAPRDDRSWENCEANQREGEEYLRVVLEESGAARVVGEDLGTVPDYVRPSLRSLGIAGFKIPQWENYPDHRSIPGSAYERVSVATFATHDHKPLRALWEEAFEKSDYSDQARHDLAKIAEFAGLAPPDGSMNYLKDFYPAIFEALFRSESWIAIVMITDLLARKDRFNVPGTAANSNWSRRLHTTVGKLGGGRALQRQLALRA